MQLHDGLAARGREVPHFLWHQQERTRGKLVHAGGVVLLAHSCQQRTL